MPGEPIRVFYNASALPARPAGAGVYTQELARALSADPGMALTVAALAPFDEAAHVRTPAGRLARLFWEEHQLARESALAAADVYHGPHFFAPRCSTPTVVTVHDLTFYRIPKRYTFARRSYYRHLARTARRADRVIVPSRSVAGDCVRYLGIAPERIRVVSEAPRDGLDPASPEAVESFRRRHALTGPYLACLGTAEPGKRAVDAVRAMPAIVEHHPDVRLLLAGNPGRLSAPLEREVARLGLSQHVSFLGYLPDDDLAPFLSGATALIFPSLYEGFGLPPLEAMACATPVIASDAPAMSEFLPPAAILVPLGDPAAIARECLALLDSKDRRQHFGALGREHAAGFSWRRAATETIAVYRELCG